jgi:predicted outer membrane repeat protein
MSDGAISGNTGGYGGGVTLSSGAAFTMSGSAVVSGNKTTEGGGGGVYVFTGATFTMSGSAVVSGNEATSSGGGVYLGQSFEEGKPGGSFEMSGGAISGNKATMYAGGVAVFSEATFTMTDGIIYGTDAAPDTQANTAVTDGGAALYKAANGIVKLNGAEQYTAIDRAWESTIKQS